MVTSRRLVLIYIKKGRLTKEKVRAACQFGDTGGILRTVEGINHIGNLLPGRFLHQAVAEITQGKITRLLLSILESPTRRDHPLVGLATAQGPLDFGKPWP